MNRIKGYLAALKKKGFYHLLSVNFLTQFLGLGGLLLLTAILSVEEIGMAKVIHSYAAFFILVGTFGYNSAILKVCSETGLTENRREDLMGSVLKFVLAASAVSYGLVWCLWIFELAPVSAEILDWLLVFCVVIPFAAMSNVMITYLQAQKKIQLMAKTQGCVRVSFFFIVIVATYIYGFEGFIYSSVISYVAGFLMFVKTSELKAKYFLKKISDNRINGFAFYAFLGGIISVLSQHADIYILEAIGVDHEVIGYYSIAVLFMMGANQVTATAQVIATPHFSEHSENKVWVVSRLIKYQILMIALSFFVAIGVYLLAYIVVDIFYGELYVPMLDYLFVLLFKYVVWSSYAITGVALLGLGAIKQGTALAAIITPISVCISFLLAEKCGVIGVAWGQVVSAIIFLVGVNILAYFVIQKKYRHNQNFV